MKVIKWIVIVGIIVAGVFLIKDIAGHEAKHINKINERHAATAEKYTTGMTKDLTNKINKDVQKAYKGLPMSPNKQ